MYYNSQLLKLLAGLGWLMMLDVHVLWATNYYLSNTGNDSNTGTSVADPWYSILHLNNATLLPGDSVLFLSGNIFRGQINITTGGNETIPLYIGTYGGTSPAIISGAETVTNWTAFSGNIFQAPLFSLPAQLFINQIRMVIARFPNSGYLIHQAGIGDSGFVDTALTQPAHYWDDAGIRMRSTDRLYEYNMVGGFSGDSILFAFPAQAALEKGYGYFLDNMITELDTAQEWYYDAVSQVLYCYPPDGNDPNSLLIEASVYDYGVKLENSAGYCTFENLLFEKQSRSAIFSSHLLLNLIVKNCRLLSQGERGIDLMNGGTGCIISSNTLHHISGAAIGASQLSATMITHNTISGIGLYPGYGINTLQQGMGISIDAANEVIIAENSIDSTGNSSINVNGLHTTVENNICNHALFHFNNQGSIFSFGSNSDSVVIRNNIIENTAGSIQASPANEITTAAIFLDQQTNHYLLENNTIAFAACHGITLYMGCTHHTIRKNTVFGCDKSQLYFEEISAGLNSEHTVRGNIFYALQESADVVALKAYEEPFIPASFDSNYYFNPYNYFSVRKLPISVTEPYGRYFTLAQWQQFYGEDAASKATFFYRDSHIVEDTLQGNLVGNGNFTNNTDGWSNSTPENLQLLLDNSTPLDNGCMKLQALSDQDISFGEAHYDGLATGPGSFFQFGFSCYSLKEGNIGFIQKQSVSPYLPLDLIRFFPFSTGRRDYQCVFPYQAADAYTSLYTHLPFADSLVWLDNISLQEVSVATEDPLKKSRLFINRTDAAQVFNLGDSIFYNLDQEVVTGTVTVPAWSSVILLFDSALITHDAGPGPPAATSSTLFIFPSLTSRGSVIHAFSHALFGGMTDVELMDLQGKLILKVPVAQPVESISIRLPENILPGIYFIIIRQSHAIFTGKLVVY